MGATACIVLPEFVDAFPNPGDWTKLAWWIHDHLPYGGLYFFPINWAFNLSWYEGPPGGISSYAGWQTESGWKKSGTLTKPGMANRAGSHEQEWSALASHFDLAKAR